MKKNKFAKILPVIIHVVFFPAFLACFAWKKGTKYVFNRRKRQAIRQAEKRSLAEGCKVFVIQIEKHFITGTRKELRRYNKIESKAVKKTGNSRFLNFDYRNAIAYATKG